MEEEAWAAWESSRNRFFAFCPTMEPLWAWKYDRSSSSDIGSMSSIAVVLGCDEEGCDFCACFENSVKRSALFPFSSVLTLFWLRVRGFSGLADGLRLAPFLLYRRES